jgi:GDP-L-fucose synthase
MANDLNSQNIYVAGHTGMAGSAILRALRSRGYKNIICKTHKELDLTNQAHVREFFHSHRPDQVYLAAARVGGIHANSSYPAEFLYQNLMIELNVIHEAYMAGVTKLLFLGSSCIYPKYANQPMSEDELLTGKLEPTNEPYAIAKIAGIKLCESYNRQYGASKENIDYRTVMPTNLYGVGDNYHLENSHVIPALIRRFHEAKLLSLPSVQIWGSGLAKREFLYVDDLAEASVFIMGLPKDIYDKFTHPLQGHINVGFGSDITIKDLAKEIGQVVGFTGDIIFDTTKPDGAPQKLLNSSLLNNLGWKPKVDLPTGLKIAYEDFINKTEK